MYKELTKEEDKFKEIILIYKTFLDDKADFQVNVKRDSVIKIEKLIIKKSKIPDDVFEEIHEEVKELLKDTYSRFKVSDEFKNL